MTIELGLVCILAIVLFVLYKKSNDRHQANETRIKANEDAERVLKTECVNLSDTDKKINKKCDDVSKDVQAKSKAVNARIDSTNKEVEQLGTSISDVEKTLTATESKLEKRITSAKDEAFSHADELNDNLVQKLETKIGALTAIIEALGEENKQLRTDLEETKRKLNFYANIEEESGNLTVDEDEEERKRLLEIAKAQILANKGKTRPQQQATSSETSSEPEKVSEVANEGVSETEAPSVPDTKEPEIFEEPSSDSILDPEQERASQYMDSSRENVFITGKAGTGKSFLLDVFVETTDKSNIVLAPTGIAALNVNGATLHSTFGYYNLVNLAVEDISERTIKLKSEKQLVLKTVQTIIIDEISMVRADTFDKIDRLLKVINRNDAPFGGKQMLVFGDLFQLPPVTKGKEYEYLMERYGGIYFYHSDAYKAGDFKFIELTINHRQTSDQSFFEILNRVREGKSTPVDIDALNNRVSTDDSVYDRYTTLFPTKAEAEYVNQTHLQALESREFVYRADVVKDKYPSKNKSIESIFPITGILKLKVGALVMMVANDPEHRWVNGTMGIVEKLSDDAIYVSINKHTYEVQKYEFKEQEVSFVNGKITYEDVFSVSQYPIVLAYAITIHKSQGQTYKNIVCDVNNCFAAGQAYVALSRCASLDGLHLRSAVTLENIQVDHDVLEFYLSQALNKAI